MGDILVFLTGQDDIDAAVQLITEEDQNRGRKSSGAEDVAALPILKFYFNNQVPNYCNLEEFYAFVHAIVMCVYVVCSRTSSIGGTESIDDFT